MSYVTTQSRSASSTMTEARVLDVMVEIAADLKALANAGFATQAQVAGWRDDLIFILKNEAASGFQVQLIAAGHANRAIDYKVAADGSIQSSQQAGGLDFFSLPANTVASLFVSLSNDKPNTTDVREALRSKGWGMNGVPVAGSITVDRSYSSSGYGVRRGLIGEIQ